MSAKHVFGVAAALLLALALGIFAGHRFWPASPQPSGVGGPAESAEEAQQGPCPNGQPAAFWQAPMDATFIRDKPGKSPMGMDLVPVCADGDGSDATGVVEVDSATVQTIGVRTAVIETRDLSRYVRALSRVAYDERRVEHVHTKVQGWIERLHVDFVGQEVRRGQPLLEIYSPALVATQEELLLASRYKSATGASPFEDVKSGGASLFDATRRRLELWDISDRDIDRLLETGEVKRTLTLYAPASGVVTMLAVRTGMEVAPNSNLYTIADLSTVWVTAQVYEYELPWIELGQTGTVEISYLPGSLLSGPVTYISPFLDPNTRTAEVRLELTNRESPVIRSGRRTLAIVALGEGRFIAREIELGLETGEGFAEVTAGLQPGEEVVVSSQFLIDSESQFREAIQKLIASRAEEPPPASPPETAPDHSAMDHSAMDHSKMHHDAPGDD
jgi:Cu(I)/Ag(I) efflux system membrane fusion protein/cobalt-zinc-cadmium efflux system membrane fusion protein